VAAAIAADRCGLLGARPPRDEDKYGGKVFRVCHVADGDTLDVDVPDRDGQATRVRLWGVDTPETVKPNTPVQHFGPEASRFARQTVAGEDVRLDLVSGNTRDRHGRLLAYVTLADGRMLNRMIVAEGYGYADPRYEHPLADEFRRLQRQAMEAGRGLWADVTQGDLPYYYQSLKLPERRGLRP
jgi:micrococcal nuclease